MTNEELTLEIQQGANRKENLMVLYQQNYGLITKTAQKFAAYTELDDLLQEAFFAVTAAADHFDPAKGSFSTYLSVWLRDAFCSYISNHGQLARVPEYMRYSILKLQRDRMNYERNYGHEPTREQLAIYSGESLKDIENIESAARLDKMRSIYETTPGAPDGQTLGETIQDPRDYIAESEDSIWNTELREALWGCVNALDVRQAEVLHRRFENNETLAAIAEAMGTYPETIRAWESKALRELRGATNVRNLKSYAQDILTSEAYRKVGVHEFQNTHVSQTERAAFKIMKHTPRKV